MSGDIRGDMFVSDATSLSMEELVTRSYEVIGPALHYEHDATAGHMVATSIPLETILDQVRQGKWISTEFEIEKIQFLFFFTRFSGSLYRTIQMFADKAYFRANDEDFNEEVRERFTDVWARLCERLEADYAYFAPLLNLVDDDVIVEAILPILEKKSVAERVSYLLYEVRSGNWLTYLGARLVGEIAVGQLEELERSEEVRVTRMPGGGLFFESEKTPY